MKMDYIEAANKHYWNPFSTMHSTINHQEVWVSGQGCEITNAAGETYLDGLAGLWYMLVGYGRMEIVEAVERQMRTLPAYGTFWNNVNEPSVKLAVRLAGLLPGDLSRIFFTSSGSEAIETALKIARQYHRMRGSTARFKVIGRTNAYHGVTLGALSVAGITANRRMYEPLLPGAVHVPHNDADALREKVEFEGPETVAAIIAEPIMGAGGVIYPAAGYLQAVREICDEHGILMIADEVICGFGRTGEWFGVNHWDVIPDIMTMAKGITSGYIPLGAVAVTPTVFSEFELDRGADGAFMHGNTYAGHPTACAAALANLDILENDDLVSRSKQQGNLLHDLLGERVAGKAGVAAVRSGLGLLCGVELSTPKEANVAKQVAEEVFRRGVIVRPIMGNVLAMAPPLIITDDELDRLTGAVASAIETVNP